MVPEGMTNISEHPHTIFRDDEQVAACTKALEIYGDLAGSEAITRALIAERTGERENAMFWLGIYKRVVDEEAKQTI